MEKRSDKRKQEKQDKKEKAKCFFGILFCIIFFIASIYVADNSINELLMDGSGKHALGIELYDNSLMVEFAGEKHDINISRIRKGIGIADKYVKIYYRRLKDYIYSKM